VYDISTIRPTWAEIDLSSLAGNLDSIRNFIGDEVEVMAVVKANAYGHGAVECAKRLEAERVHWFAVATLEEAVELRQGSINGRILVVGGIWPGQEREFLNFDITPQIMDVGQAEKLNSEAARHDVVVKVHVKVDTGMNRVGIRPEELEHAAARLADLANIRVEGLMTQFAAADKLSENEFTEHQMAKFAEAVGLFHRAGHRPEYVDMANSPGAVMHPLSRSKLVRIGGLLYGLADDIIPENVHRPAVKAVMSLFSRVAQVKRVPAGETVGYGRTFTAARDCTIATIPIGYNDGYRRVFSNLAHAVVNGGFAPVAGRNSMDWTTIDVTDCGDVTAGTKVTLIGEDGENKVTAKDLAEICDTISYEITCGIGARIPRVYSGKVV
jgi:alanine racemase